MHPFCSLAPADQGTVHLQSEPRQLLDHVIEVASLSLASYVMFSKVFEVW